MSPHLLVAVAFTACAFLLRLLPDFPLSYSPPDTSASMAEGYLRRSVAAATPPACPTSWSSLELPQVVVVRVHLSLDGAVMAIDPVQSPGPDVTGAISAAIAQWRFHVLPEDIAARTVISSNLTFYLESGDSGCRVIDSTVAPSFEEWSRGPRHSAGRSPNISTMGGGEQE
jgi:hypothetical protein